MVRVCSRFQRDRDGASEQRSGAQNLARPFGLRPKFRHTVLQHLPRDNP